MASSQSKPLTVLLWLVRLALGGIFIYAAWTKLREPWLLFAMAIDAYKVLPQWAVLVVARTLPWFELALGLVLISGRLPKTSSLAVSALLAVFFGMMVRAYAMGEKIACGCFSTNETISPLTLARDGSLLLGALFLVAMSFRKSKKHRAEWIADSVRADLRNA